ncbi:hypothetical protein EVAR_93016_1 [Eumeta japonica]|uniref:Uncharacterized protein n=1 Tax=Eumeta variegata TaxID=151549 RepID=A0A4C2AEJ5_EUMVA|nr:hypothetical protein EVAR_93016_1 [Eumeta japonica]
MGIRQKCKYLQRTYSPLSKEDSVLWVAICLRLGKKLMRLAVCSSVGASRENYSEQSNAVFASGVYSRSLKKGGYGIDE